MRWKMCLAELAQSAGILLTLYLRRMQKDWTNPLWGLGDRAEHNLAKLGIECHSSTGVWGGGAGSVNNTYRDMKTGQYLLHEEVLDYIRTGNKSWIK